MKKVFIVLLAALCGMVPQTLFAQAASAWVFYGSDGNLHYKTDSLGNPIMDFSYAGYQGGGAALPNVTTKQTVGPSGGDDTAAIQAAINAVSALAPDANGFRGAVLLAAGTFNVSGTLNINTSGVVLRGSGSGSGGTVINMSSSATPFLLFALRGSGSWQTATTSASMTDVYVHSGTLSFNVDNPSLFSVGSTVLISRPVTQAWVNFMGMNDLVSSTGTAETWLGVGSTITTDRTITAINGSQLTLDAPLTDSFDSTLLNPPGGSVATYTFPGRISQVGVEHLSVIAPAVNVDITMPQYVGLSMSAVINGWAQDVVFQDTQNTVTISGNVKQVTLDNIHVKHTITHTGDRMADFGVSGTQIFLNNSSSDGTGEWPFVTQGRVTGPNAILNFESTQQAGISAHQRWATGLLADNCTLPNAPNGIDGGTTGISFSDRGNHGSGQGWAMGWGVAWNVTTPFFVVQMPPGAANWCIGCIGTEDTANEPGDGDPIANGFYDSLGTLVTPSSLYLAQLCQRLGTQAAANIGYSGVCPAAADFSVTPAQSSLSVTAGGSASDTVTVSALNGFTGTVALSVNGVPSGATASFNPTSVTGSGSSTVTIATGTAATGTYTLTITGTSGGLTHSTTVTLNINPSTSLPAGWNDTDIGMPGLAGSASFSNGVFTVNGSGTDIWSSSDSFNYASESLTGDVTITARVASQQNTSAWAKSGVMIRETTAANAAYVFVFVTPSNGVNMQYRASTGTSSVQLAQQTGLVAPYWVRLVRSGSTFTGFSSADGVTWTQVGTISVTMATNALEGLAVCAHNNTALNTSTFDNVTLSTPAPDFSISPSPSSQTVTAGGSTSYTASVTPINGFTGTVNLSVSGLPTGATASFSPTSIGGSGSSTLSISTSTTASTGAFTLTITGTGVSTTHSTAVNLTINPPPAPDFSISPNPSSQTVTAGGSTSYTASVSPLNGFTGTVNLSVSGLPSGATGTFNPTSISGSGSSTLSISTSSTASTGSFTLTITGTSASLSHSTTVSLTINPSTGLPSGWSDTDIGTPAVAGSASFSNGVFTVNGSGSDVWSTSDSFNYASESLSGSVTITARLASQQNTNAWAKSGVMIRETTAANAAYVFVFVTPSNGVNMQYRASTGTSSVQLAQQTGVAAPYWVRLVRSGSTFTGFSSADGVTWTQVATISVSMASNALGGLAVCAHNTVLNTSTFDNVSVSVPTGPTAVYQINSGGGAVTPFAADAFFSAGQTASITATIDTSAVTNPAPMAVYQTERWGGDASSNPAPFSYTFPNLTAGASYTVRLHFAEIFWTTTGQREFNVAINGTQVLTNFDIIAAAGAANKAIVEQFTTTADSSGQIVVSYTVGAVDAPKSSGIEIIAN